MKVLVVIAVLVPIGGVQVAPAEEQLLLYQAIPTAAPIWKAILSVEATYKKFSRRHNDRTLVQLACRRIGGTVAAPLCGGQCEGDNLCDVSPYTLRCACLVSTPGR